MANEVINVAVDTKDVAAAGTPEALTTREIQGTSVFIIPKAANTGAMFIADDTTDSKLVTIPTGGITLPILDPRLITIDSAVNGEGVEWMCV